jgi:hypothetical protein
MLLEGLESPVAAKTLKINFNSLFVCHVYVKVLEKGGCSDGGCPF